MVFTVCGDSRIGSAEESSEATAAARKESVAARAATGSYERSVFNSANPIGGGTEPGREPR
jgi:hypothetical protein